MLQFLKRLSKTGAAALFCLGLSYSLPTFAAPVNITPSLQYDTTASNQYTFSNANHKLFVVEQTGSAIGSTVYTIKENAAITQEEKDKAWLGFNGSKNALENVAYLHYNLSNVESAYLEDVAHHCRLLLDDVADGVGELPNHHERYQVYNVVDGKELFAAIAKIDNARGIEISIYGGPMWIKGTDVRVRKEPNTNCEVLGYFENREEIDVLGYVKPYKADSIPGEWAYVKRPNGQYGYVSAQFVTDNGDVVENFEDYLEQHLQNSSKYSSWKNYNFDTIDSYSGEGPRATSTLVIKVYQSKGNTVNTLGVFHVCSDGTIKKRNPNTDTLENDN